MRRTGTVQIYIVNLQECGQLLQKLKDNLMQYRARTRRISLQVQFKLCIHVQIYFCIQHKPFSLFYIEFWVSGRDKSDITQFVWNTTGNEVLSNLPFVKTIYTFPYQTCLRYYSKPNYGSHFYPSQCYIGVSGVICEIF